MSPDIAITIEATPAGITIRCAYTGAIESIPETVKRLQQAGILQLVGSPVVIEQPAPSIGTAMPELEGRTTVKVATAAKVLGLDSSTIRRYGKAGKLQIVDGRLVSVESIRAFARGEHNEYQSETKVRRKGIEISASRPKPQPEPEQQRLTARPTARGPKPGGPLKARRPK